MAIFVVPAAAAAYKMYQKRRSLAEAEEGEGEGEGREGEEEGTASAANAKAAAGGDGSSTTSSSDGDPGAQGGEAPLGDLLKQWNQKYPPAQSQPRRMVLDGSRIRRARQRWQAAGEREGAGSGGSSSSSSRQEGKQEEQLEQQGEKQEQEQEQEQKEEGKEGPELRDPSAQDQPDQPKSQEQPGGRISPICRAPPPRPSEPGERECEGHSHKQPDLLCRERDMQARACMVER